MRTVDSSHPRFVQHKNELKTVGLELLQDLAAQGIIIKSIRCDNASENRQFESECRKEKMNIQFEYTAPGTPQQNGVSERKFATLFGRVRAMNTAAGLTSDIRQQLWAEAANCATYLECLVITKKGQKTPYELVYGKQAPYATYLRTFGEVGVIRDIDTIKQKLQDRGNTSVFVGYAAQHAWNVHRMMCLETGQLRLSRDIKWLGQSYGSYTGAQIREDTNMTTTTTIQMEMGRIQIVGISIKIILMLPHFHSGYVKAETNTTPAERVYDHVVATNADPDEGWHVVRAGRETIEYEARPSGRTRSGVNYKIQRGSHCNS
jgi:hypothetical protein